MMDLTATSPCNQEHLPFWHAPSDPCLDPVGPMGHEARAELTSTGFDATSSISINPVAQ